MSGSQRPLPRQRVERLRSLVLRRGAVTVTEAVELFAVSPMTARRDLGEVTRSTPGVVRVHGGAVLTHRAASSAPRPPPSTLC